MRNDRNFLDLFYTNIPELDVIKPLSLERLQTEGRAAVLLTMLTFLAKYAFYIGQQEMQNKALLRKEESILIPRQLDFQSLDFLTIEQRLLLTDSRPETLAQARRIQGVTPVSLMLLMRHIKLTGPRGTSPSV